MLLARMAEAVYWAGRYLERAECTARIIQVHVDTHIDLPVGEDVGWEPLLAIAGADTAFTERFGPVGEAGMAGMEHGYVLGEAWSRRRGRHGGPERRAPRRSQPCARCRPDGIGRSQ